jgi:deoxycytidylate deaminase
MDYDELQLVAPIAKQMMKQCYEASRKSTCLSRSTGALLELQDGSTFFGSNGDKAAPCIECTRDTSVEMLQYVTCPSRYAESEAMLQALICDKDVQNAKLFTNATSFDMLGRDLIIGFRIGEVYFRGRKNGRLLNKEKLYLNQMASKGIKLFKLGENLEEIVAEKTNISVPRKEQVKSVEFWFDVIYDGAFREGMKLLLKNKRNSQAL